MAALVSIAELRKMQVVDLLKEITQQKNLVAKLRLAVQLQKEKDSAKYKREKKQLAKMQTVLSEKAIEAEEAKSTTPEK